MKGFCKQIFIIDDHQLFSAGLQQILLTLTDRSCIHCYSNPEQALTAVQLEAPDLIVLDFYIPGFDIPHWIAVFIEHFAGCPIVVFSSSISPSDKKACLDAGAIKYFEKHLPPDIVLANIEVILNGSEIHPEENDKKPEHIHSHGLTSRQMDILIQLARGNSNKKIAEKLGISPETVKSHLSSVYKQLGFSTRGEANEWAHKHGMV